MVEVLLIVLVVLSLAAVGLLAVLLRRSSVDHSPLESQIALLEEGQDKAARIVGDELARGRAESADNARQLREEVANSVRAILDSIVKSLGEGGQQQTLRLDQLRDSIDQRLTGLQGSSEKKLGEIREEGKLATQSSRAEITGALKEYQDLVQRQMTENAGAVRVQLADFLTRLNSIAEGNEKRMEALRGVVDQRLREMQEDNTKKLEQMRQTVDEKLEATLEKRLGESFKRVSENLEAVHRGLGEMQTLASGVGDLKKVLTNVKSRGTWGEVQLGSLLEQMLTRDQYETNVATKPGSQERVEFAVKMPGLGNDPAIPAWLPIDSKCPVEDYVRLGEAAERGDVEAVKEHSRQLESRIKACGRDIAQKYLSPPHTVNIAILFVPTEGLYAEVLRCPGLAEHLQNEHRVMVAGPTTLSALLNCLQMGFRTLAIEKRSSEVWSVLSAVKTEFGKFGAVFEKVKRKLEEATRTVDDAGVRTRAIERKLKTVDELPAPEASALLGLAGPRPPAPDDLDEDENAA